MLRSFGKTYGLAGLRLGFAIGDAALVGRLREAMGPWAVAGPALADRDDRAVRSGAGSQQAAQARAADAARLDALLAPHGRLIGGTSLFRLLACQDAAALFAHLGRHGLYVRRFQHQPDHLRFGLPADATGMATPGGRRCKASLSAPRGCVGAACTRRRDVKAASPR